ncbi:MAG TPA: YdcF family protein [Candidatus Didemnitutus sp.]|nr:YdcF family protein [Candidatus Didemnitutus sp.]
MLMVNKILPVFALPMGWVMILLAVAIWRRKRWPVVAALVVLYVTSLPPVANALLTLIERGNPPVGLSTVNKADAVVALGGIFGPSTDNDYVPNFADAAARLEGAIALWQHGKCDWVIFTGARISWLGRKELEGAVSKRAAAARGVPADRIVITGEIENTRDEAQAVAALMKQRGWKKVILVTSAWHMPRAAHLFRKAGVEFIPFPVDFRHDAERKFSLLDFFPTADSLTATSMVLREWYGLAFYTLIGR